MRVLLIIAVSLAFWSCQSKSTSASARDTPAGDAPVESSQKGERDAPAIVLDATEQQKGHIVVESVGLKDLATTLTVPGRLTINEDKTWRVGAIASGRVNEVSAHLGDAVRPGQILGRIHSHDVHEVRAGYEQAQTELERAGSAQDYAKQRRERAQRLFDLRAGSRQDVETADADLRNTQAAIDKAQSELEKERAHLAILRVPVEDNSPLGNHSEDDDVPILAPEAGVVLDRKATVGSVVNTGEELFTISDTTNLWMIGAANERDLSIIRAGQPVRIEVRAYPNRAFVGRILKLGEHMDPATRTLQIRIAVPNPQGLLKPEMYATASVRQSGRRSALIVPDEAVQEIDGVLVVFVRETQNEFRAHPVEIGQHAEGELEIVRGLKSGEAVVVKGGFALKSHLLKLMIQDQ
ncbi:MAG: family efflux transporter, subunit [Bryobacterales bacterium]|nr:family efflux transporter, subunit [Bryobacterales bacterium]